MKPSEIEDQIVTYTNKTTGRTITGRMMLCKGHQEPDQWRLVYDTTPVGGVHFEEDMLLPFEIHEAVKVVDGKLVLEQE